MLSLSVAAEGPFRVGLWAAGSAPQRVEAARKGLERAVGPELRRAGFEGIEVESSADYERRFADLRQGRFDLLEAEPGTYFLARRRWLAYDPERWRYELIFQRLSAASQPSTIYGAIASRSRSGLMSPTDLRGKILGILSPYGLASGGIQLLALEQLGLERERDFRLVQADSEDNLCKCLFSGLVDAVALPDGRVEAFLARHRTEHSRMGGVDVLYQSELLPGPLWCIHQRLVEEKADLAALLRQRLPAALPEERLMPTRDAYYRTTRERVARLEELM